MGQNERKKTFIFISRKTPADKNSDKIQIKNQNTILTIPSLSGENSNIVLTMHPLVIKAQCVYL